MMTPDTFAGRPRHESLDWPALASRFDAYIMDPANGVAFTNSRGERAFTAYLEAPNGPMASHELFSYGPIVIGKLLLGDDVSDLLPSLAGYFSEEYCIYLNSPGKARIELWYLVHGLSLAAHITVTALRSDPAAMDRLHRSLGTLQEMAHRLDYNFNHQGYDFRTCQTWTNENVYRQPDTIGGYGYLMLLGHTYFGESIWLTETEIALSRYLESPINLWYEVPSMAMAVIAAAELKDHGRSINVARTLDLLLDPDAGLLAGQWGEHEVTGLYRGYRSATPDSAYSLETLVVLPLILPAIHAVPDLASRIGAYALHTAANERLFYPAETAGGQSRAGLTSDIPYERVFCEFEGQTAFAGGDFYSHKSIYGGAYTLWWGALVQRTEVPWVLRFDLGKTNFLCQEPKACWLYYNPWDTPQTVQNLPASDKIEIPAGSVRITPEKGEVQV